MTTVRIVSMPEAPPAKPDAPTKTPPAKPSEPKPAVPAPIPEPRPAEKPCKRPGPCTNP